MLFTITGFGSIVFVNTAQKMKYGHRQTLIQRILRFIRTIIVKIRPAILAIIDLYGNLKILSRALLKADLGPVGTAVSYLKLNFRPKNSDLVNNQTNMYPSTLFYITRHD